MSKIIRSGFTDYFITDTETNTPIVAVEILSYDNNKYATVKKPDGEVVEIKTGYIYRDAALTRRLRDVDWFVLGGGNRKNFRPRVSETNYRVFGKSDDPRGEERRFKSRAKAIAYAVAMAKRQGYEVEVYTTTQRQNTWRSGGLSFVCYETGQVAKYNNDRHALDKATGKHYLVPTYMRGYGKAPSSPAHRRNVFRMYKK